MITIDGSKGEGGGQLLRSSLTLSMLTGRPFRMTNIRAKRDRPGLMRQHLTAVQAAKAISRASVEGDRMESTDLVFQPGEVDGGDFTFRVGTAGSTMLVLQTVLLPLALAQRPSRVVLEGGTHNPFAPPFDFLERAYVPILNRMGPKISLDLEVPGFYPAGGGRAVVHVQPVVSLEPMELIERGEPVHRSARAVISNLRQSIAVRELDVIRKRLRWDESELKIEVVKEPNGPGNVVSIELAYERVTEVFTGFGQINRSAEAVATYAVQQCQRYMNAEAPAGEYLTDQLILPLACAGQGVFHGTDRSSHAETHVQLIDVFLPGVIECRQVDERRFEFVAH